MKMKISRFENGDAGLLSRELFLRVQVVLFAFGLCFVVWRLWICRSGLASRYLFVLIFILNRNCFSSLAMKNNGIFKSFFFFGFDCRKSMN